MTLTETEMREIIFDGCDPGYCTECDDLTRDQVEPDAENYECPQCGNMTVMGAETAFVMEHIEVTED